MTIDELDLRYLLSEAEAEIVRHHFDLNLVSILVERGLNGKNDPIIALKAIRQVVG